MNEPFRADLSARQSSLTRLLDRFEEYGRVQRIPAALRRAAHLALDEIVSNVIRHGSNKGQPSRLSVAVGIHDGVLKVEISDDGPPFDPTKAPRYRPSGPVQDRPTGGLGLALVNEFMDDVRYSRRNGRNRLVMTKRKPARRDRPAGRR